MVKVGASQKNIVPKLPVTLGGTFAKIVTDIVHDPLYASSIVIDNGEAKIALISCDLGRLDSKNVEYVRNIVSKETGIKSCNIHISATHNHQGPTIVSFTAFKGDADQELASEILDKVASSVIEANEDLKPCKMGYGKGMVEKCGFNRRYIMSNGRSMMHPGPNNPDRLMVEGPVDKEVQVVWFEDMEGNYKAVLVNYSSHTAILYAKNFVSADYVGEMRSVLQNIIGKEVPVLFMQGCCGNVHPADQENDIKWGRDLEGVRRVGRILGGEVLKIISSNYALYQDIEIEQTTKIVQLPYKDITQEQIEKAMKLRDEYEKMGWENARKRDIEERAFVNSTLSIVRLKKDHPNCIAEMSAFRLNDIYFVTNPAELFVEYQLEIKNRFKGKNVIVTELTDGYIAYVPTKQAFALGGYEAVNSRMGWETGSIITSTSIELLESIMV